MSYLGFLFLGLTVGAVYAVVAVGIVTIFKGSGVINFSHGAIGLVGIYLYDELHNRNGLDAVLAFVLAVCVCTLLGATIQIAIFSTLTRRRAPVLAKILASVAVLLVLQQVVQISYVTDISPVAILSQHPVNIGSVQVPIQCFIMAGIAVGIAMLTAILFRRTRLGIAIHANAENQESLSTAGWSPSLLGGVAWAWGSATVSAIAILAAATTGADIGNYPLIVVPALAAVLLGRMNSVIVATSAAIGLGMLQSEVTYLSTKTWWPDWGVNGITQVIPFVAIVLVLVVLGKSLPGRAMDLADRLPHFRRDPIPWWLPVTVLGLFILGFYLFPGSEKFGLITTCIVAIAASSFVIITGLLGQISLAQLAVAGMAGFGVARIGEVPFPLSLLVGVLIGGVFGTLIGLPALRIRGAQLAVVSIAAALGVQEFVFNNQSLYPLQGILVPEPKLFGYNLSVRIGSDIATWQFFALVLVMLIGVIGLLYRITRGATGKRFLAVRSNERVAASLGINVSGAKILGYFIASGIVSLFGALLSYSYGSLSGDSFTVEAGLSLLVIAYIGGIGSISGAVVAGLIGPLGIIYVLVQNIHLGQWYLLISSVLLLEVLIVHPAGITSNFPLHIPKRWLPVKQPYQNRAVSLEGPTDVGEHLEPSDHTPKAEVGLRVTDLTVRYGSVRAVDQVNLLVESGQIIGLVGPNGAGKTSLVDAITGFARATGEIRVGNREIQDLPPHSRYAAGIARTWQSSELFSELTVRENVQIGSGRSGLRSLMDDFLHPHREGRVDVDQALSMANVLELADIWPRELTNGQQKLVGLARCLASNAPILLLDEPGAGLDTAETDALAKQLRLIASLGHGILLIDHDMDLVFDVCDIVYVLDFGRVICSGAAAEVRDDKRVIEAYLGVTESQDQVPVEADLGTL